MKLFICCQSFSRRAEKPGGVVNSFLNMSLVTLVKFLNMSLVILSGDKLLLKLSVDKSAFQNNLLYLGSDRGTIETGSFCLTLQF